MRSALIFSTIATATIACGGAGPVEDPVAEEEVQLIDHSAWAVVDADHDPFDDRPAAVECPATAYGAEGSVFEVDTGECNYVTLTQPVPVDLVAGDRIAVTLWHLKLWAEEPAEAHVALALGRDVLVEQHIPIPSPEGLMTMDVAPIRDAPAGTPIYFHLHNHGDNSWTLADVVVTR